MGNYCPNFTNMALITKEISIDMDYFLSNTLLKDVFMRTYKFNYEKVGALSPLFEKIVFNAYSDKPESIIGTISLSRPNEKKMFPSNFYFGFKTPSYIDLATTVEMGRLVKSDKPEFKEYDKLIYLSLLLAVKFYSQSNGITHWVAAVHDTLLDSIQKLGIQVQIIATKPLRMKKEIREAMGTYPKNVIFITATMEDSFRALEKFQYLIDNGSITIELNKPTLS